MILHLLAVLIWSFVNGLSVSAGELTTLNQQNWAEVAENVRRSVVTIETQKGQGTGFIVRSNGVIVTNNHVIKGATTVSITLANGDVYKDVYVLRTDDQRDIALLRIEAIDLPFLELANSDNV